MPVSHHPRSDILLAYATGHLGEASSLLVASHLTLCPACRATVGRMEAIGGAVLESLPSQGSHQAGLSQLMARLDLPTTQDNAPATAIAPVDSSVAALPRPLHPYVTGRTWKRLGNVEFITLTTTGRGVGRLLRIPAGGSLPFHGHTGAEQVLVLAGGFHDGVGNYVRGDVASADPTLAHAPVAHTTETCVCMTVNEGMVLFTKLLAPLARLFQPRTNRAR